MDTVTTQRHQRIGKLASLGLVVVLVMLPAVALWGQIAIYRASMAARLATEISDALETARYDVSAEESLNRKYRLEPSPSVLARHAAAGTAMVAALERAGSLGVDRGFIDAVLNMHRQYLDAIGAMFAAIDAHDSGLATKIDGSQVDPRFDDMEARVQTAASDSRTSALAHLSALSSIQARILLATTAAFVLGAILVMFFVGVLRTFGRRTEDAMRREVTATRDRELRFRELVQNASDVILICAASGSVTYQSPAAESGWDYAQDELLGQAIVGLVHPDGQPALRAVWDQIQDMPEELAAGRTKRTELQMRDGSGKWRYVELILTNRLHEPAIAGVIATIRDIRERKAFELQLTQQAFYDSLTRLPNRLLLHDRLNQALVRATRRGSQVALLFVDLDNFKLINDSLGHSTGDHLLIEAAARLQSCVRAEDTVARLGGDEFVVVLEYPTDATDAVAVAEAITRRFDAIFRFDGRDLTVTISVGIALGDAGIEHADDLMRNADVAMYRAKNGGKARHVLFEPSMHVNTLARLELEYELRHAIDNGELRIHYQPVVALQSGKVGEVEALVRWQHPKQGLMMPAAFIPIAEETGLIVPLGQWVLERACRQVAAWHARFPTDSPLTLSVNLSPRQFQHLTLVGDVKSALSAQKADCRRAA